MVFYQEMICNNMEENNTISLCMIVRNEEKNIKRALDSLLNTIDELIIVDTGSTDNTIEIAKPYGAKIFNFEWNCNFSDARNFALKQATCDWIFIMDADEEIEQTTKSLLYEAIQYDQGIANFLFVTSRIGNDIIQTPQARLFRNYQNIEYSNIVNENIFSSIKRLYLENKRTFRVYPIYINHFGIEEDSFIEKVKRNYSLIDKAIEVENNSLSKLGLILNKIDYIKILGVDIDSIPVLLGNALELSSKINEKIFKFDDQSKALTYEIIQNLLVTNNNEKAYNLINNIMRFYPNSFNLIMMKINCLKALNKNEEIEENIQILRTIISDNTYDEFETTNFNLMNAITLNSAQQNHYVTVDNSKIIDDAPGIITVDDFVID